MTLSPFDTVTEVIVPDNNQNVVLFVYVSYYRNCNNLVYNYFITLHSALAFFDSSLLIEHFEFKVVVK